MHAADCQEIQLEVGVRAPGQKCIGQKPQGAYAQYDSVLQILEQADDNHRCSLCIVSYKASTVFLALKLRLGVGILWIESFLSQL